jgi:hypothetical protein
LCQACWKRAQPEKERSLTSKIGDRGIEERSEEEDTSGKLIAACLRKSIKRRGKSCIRPCNTGPFED